MPVNATKELRLDHDIALRSSKNELLAILTVEEIYCSADSLAVPGLFAAFYQHAPFLLRLHL